MNTNALKVYELLKKNWGKEEASTVLKYLESTTAEKIRTEIKSKIAHLATKGDINELRSELKEDINAVSSKVSHYYRILYLLKESTNKLSSPTFQILLFVVSYHVIIKTDNGKNQKFIVGGV